MIPNDVLPFISGPTSYFPASSLILMALQYITWNRLYAAQPRKRAFAKTRILDHFVKMRLSERGVEKASVRYVFRIFHCCAFNTDQFLQTDRLAWGEQGCRGWRPYYCGLPAAGWEARSDAPRVSDGCQGSFLKRFCRFIATLTSNRMDRAVLKPYN